MQKTWKIKRGVGPRRLGNEATAVGVNARRGKYDHYSVFKKKKCDVDLFGVEECKTIPNGIL
jgi:hypothetical protein